MLEAPLLLSRSRPSKPASLPLHWGFIGVQGEGLGSRFRV